MKLRIRGNSLRLRLQQAEVRKLQADGCVSESVNFNALHSLSFSIQASNAESVSASFLNNRITVQVPIPWIESWVATNQIGFSAEQVLETGETLKILVEKDFFCLKPRTMGQDEDESDAFPNPNESCGQVH